MLQATQLLGIYLTHAHSIIMFSLKTSVFLWKLKKLSLYQNEKKHRKKLLRGKKHGSEVKTQCLMYICLNMLKEKTLKRFTGH